MSNLQTLIFYATPEHDCSYLEGKKATTMFVDPKAKITIDLYDQLSQLGFRRSGHHYYRPHCNACDACIPVRVPADLFKRSRSQKRVWRLNRDVQTRIVDPEFREEHYTLYERYINLRHADGDMYPPSREQYQAFLIDSHPNTFFVEFWLNDQLYGISVIDRLKEGLSAVYTYFDPDLDYMSPGTYSILWQIEECKRRQLKYLYLGYWLKECRKMAYKKQFRPFQARIDDLWQSDHITLIDEDSTV